MGVFVQKKRVNRFLSVKNLEVEEEKAGGGERAKEEQPWERYSVSAPAVAISGGITIRRVQPSGRVVLNGDGCWQDESDGRTLVAVAQEKYMM